jgi:hypothetical protein
MDALSQKRVLCLRDEIASLRHDNESYRLTRPSTRLEVHANESRRIRLLAIQEELRAMGISAKGHETVTVSGNTPSASRMALAQAMGSFMNVIGTPSGSAGQCAVIKAR